MTIVVTSRVKSLKINRAIAKAAGAAVSVLVCLAISLPAVGDGDPQRDQQDDAQRPLLHLDFDADDDTGNLAQLIRHEHLEVVEREGVDRSNALRATYKGFKQGSERIVRGIDLPRHVDDATLLYDVRFDRNFQFSRGGKLHGLGPDQPITGGRPMKPDGWSARIMWHPSGVNTYVYSQNKKRKYGEKAERFIPFTFEKDRYYAVTIYVKLNKPVERANGSMRVYINGVGIADHQNIQFRSVDHQATKISQLLFSTFHGGSSPQWAPQHPDGSFATVHAYFDNFAVYEGLRVRKQPGE